jgi:hypothetical protein
MRITDIMILLVIFGLGMSVFGYFILNIEAQYGLSEYTETYNPGEYQYLIQEQGALADGASGLAESNTQLGSGGTTSDPYSNIFIGGWNAIKSLVGIGSNVENLQANLQESTQEAGLQIPGFVWAALATAAAIIILATLINATQKVIV